MQGSSERVLPRITGFNRPFWDGLKKGIFQSTRCVDCKAIHFPPRCLCPHCFSDQYEWAELSGKATLYSFTEHIIVPRAYIDDVPYITAMVDLVEGPRLLSRIKGASYEQLRIGQEVRVGFEPLNDQITIFFFRPLEA